nr:hypothetical protein CFP56_68052 [Quercus suber]
MRAEQFKQSRKSVVVISRSAHSQAPWGRKFKSPSSSNNGHSDDNFSASSKHGSKGDLVSTMKVDQRKNALEGPDTAKGGSLKEGMAGGNSVATGLKIQSRPLEDCMKLSEAETEVQTLINSKLCAQKSNLVQQLFLPQEATAILGIPLSRCCPPDKIAWAYTPSGAFRTRSAYKNSSGRELRVPNKFKHFVW